MERVPAKSVVVTYSRRGDLKLDHPRLAQVKAVLDPVFSTFNEMREKVDNLEPLFSPPKVSREEATRLVALATPDIGPIQAAGRALTRLVQSIELSDLNGKSPFLPTKPLDPSEHDQDRIRRIVLTHNFSIKKLWQNIEVTEHDLRSPTTGLVVATQLHTRRVSTGGELDWNYPRDNYFRLQGFLLGWEDRAEGKIKKEKLPIGEFHLIIKQVLSHEVRGWLIDRLGKNEEEATQIMSNILRIPELPEDQKDLFLNYDTKEFVSFVNNLAQNFIRFMEEKGGTDHIIKHQFAFNARTELWEWGMHDNLKGFDEDLFDQSLGQYRYKRKQSRSADPTAKGIGMYHATEVLKKHGGSYFLENNDMGGASQYYRFPTTKRV